MKRTIALILMFMMFNTLNVSAFQSSVVDHKWEVISKDSSGNSIFIDKGSVINVNNLVNFREPYFQIFVKTNEGIFACAFRLHNGVKYFSSVAVDDLIDDLIYTPSTAEQKWNVYADMVKNGEDPYVARHASEMFHNKFRENNIKKLSDGIIKYGLNDKGALNPVGIYLLFNLANENPQYTAQLVQQLPFATDFVEIPQNSIAASIYDVAFRYALTK